MKEMRENISIVLSVLGFALSIFATYVTLRTIDDVQVRVVQFSMENDPRNHAADNVTTHIAIINRGNQSLLVTGAEFLVLPKLDYSEGGFGGPICALRGALPVVVEGGKIVIIGLSQKVTTLEDATLKGSSSIHYGLRIASVDSRGRERGAKLMLAEVDLKDGLVSSYKDEHPTASLDGNERITFAVNDAECAAQAQT